MLFGGAGRDRLVGGAGEDELYGGAGDDTFIFGSAAVDTGLDIIFGFADGELIDLSRIDADGTRRDDQRFGLAGEGFSDVPGAITYLNEDAGVYLRLNTDRDEGPEALILLLGRDGAPVASDFVL